MSLRALLIAVLAAALGACAVHQPQPGPGGGGPEGASTAGGAQPESGTPAQPGAPEKPAPGGPRQFHLGTAASALVTQAHRQAGGGDFGPAAATLERALRIEPENPLLWVELGRVRLAEGNTAQADALGRKALALASGDPSAQADAWRLIAEAFRAGGRNAEAADAEQHAAALAPR
jgi:Tfp pilus assembly protein PilF